MNRTPIVEFRGVTKRFGATDAVRDVSFAIAPGEFYSLLGPSGCGKSTTLRLLAGFERPDQGEVLIAGEVVNDRRPYERNLGMVFQQYALFPHLSVERNVSFGLEQRKRPAGEIRDRVQRALELVRLDASRFASRLPSELSGGQRQRVALARALVLEPPVLLLDEPLGALDLKLRKEMQAELKALNRALGTTFVYVTHDQEEALAMSDRIAVMSEARIAQEGTPASIYEDPRTRFVAGFIGEVNLLEGRVVARAQGGGWTVTGEAGSYFVPGHPTLAEGRVTTIAIRPEWLDLARPGEVPPGENALEGVVEEIVYLGETIHVRVRSGTRAMTVAIRNEGQLQRPIDWRRGDDCLACWLPDDCQVLEE